MWHTVFVVNNTILYKFLIRKVSVLLCSYAGLTEIYHRGLNSISEQIHRTKLSESSSEGVSSRFDFVGWVLLHESAHLSQSLCVNSLEG